MVHGKSIAEGHPIEEGLILVTLALAVGIIGGLGSSDPGPAHDGAARGYYTAAWRFGAFVCSSGPEARPGMPAVPSP